MTARTAGISLMTFNMQFGQIWDPADPDRAPCDIEKTIEEIRRLAPDIVYLQEVERVVPELGQVLPPPNFSRLQAALPEYHAVFSYPAPDARELPFGYGEAILSRTPLDAVESIHLPAPDLEFTFQGAVMQPTQRLLLAAQTVIEGQRVQLFNTHLQAFFIIDRSSDDYPAQRNVIEGLLRDSQLPTLLAGDFNSAPGEGIVRQFELADYRSVQEAQITWKRMPYVLDHIFYSRHFELLSHRVVPTDAADHDILLARFRLQRSV